MDFSAILAADNFGYFLFAFLPSPFEKGVFSDGKEFVPELSFLSGPQSVKKVENILDRCLPASISVPFYCKINIWLFKRPNIKGNLFHG